MLEARIGDLLNFFVPWNMFLPLAFKTYIFPHFLPLLSHFFALITLLPYLEWKGTNQELLVYFWAWMEWNYKCQCRSMLLNMRTQRMGLIQTEDQLRWDIVQFPSQCFGSGPRYLWGIRSEHSHLSSQTYYCLKTGWEMMIFPLLFLIWNGSSQLSVPIGYS